MKNYISIQKRKGIVVPTTPKGDSRAIAYSLNTEVMRLGYILSESLLTVLSATEDNTVIELSKDVIKRLQELKGADVEYTPMYPNFPQQVIDASCLELYLNAICHYWTSGQWLPEYTKEIRDFADIPNKLKVIDHITDEQFEDIFTSLLGSNDSLSKTDQGIVFWFLDNYDKGLKFPKVIPYKETACLLGARALNKGGDISPYIKTATDLLRLITHLSEGDISLASNTKFKSLPRKIRRVLTQQLETVINEEDIQRHRNKWIRLFHNLHVGEYAHLIKVNAIAVKARNKKKLYSTVSKVEGLLKDKQWIEASSVLQKRPGDFTRRIDHLLRSSNKHEGRVILSNFLEICPEVSTRVLLQLIGHLNVRSTSRERVIFPKGSVAKAQKIPPVVGSIDASLSVKLKQDLEYLLIDRFKQQEGLGKVWIAPELQGCPLPVAQRSSMDGLNIVARGTRLPIGDDNTLRMFIYWVGQDIDLSATLHGEDFENLGHISYTRLRSSQYQAYHSGDITRALNGASEFIDLTLDKLEEHGIRYVVMNVLVFNGPTFKEHTKCYAGWMTRSAPQSNEIYDPKTVQNKVDMQAESLNAIPAVFDVATRESIWCDINTPRKTSWFGNNVESNRASIADVLGNILNMSNRLNLYYLFKLHALARGSLVEEREEADTIFSLEEGIGPWDINTINADFLA